MTEETSADSLLTDTTKATKAAATRTGGKPLDLDAAVIDPAAVHDEAARLDPAKVKQPAPAKPKRKRNPTKAQRAVKRAKASIAADNKVVAKDAQVIAGQDHDDARRAEGRAAYEAAVAHEVESFVELPEDGALELRLADGGEFHDGAIAVGRDRVHAGGQGVTYAEHVEIGPEGPPVRVSEAWLIAATGEAVRCAVGPLSGGGGYHARIPAGHLKF